MCKAGCCQETNRVPQPVASVAQHTLPTWLFLGWVPCDLCPLDPAHPLGRSPRFLLVV